MKCQCGKVEYPAEWAVSPGGAPLPAGTPLYCGTCTTAAYPVTLTEQYERFGATLPAIVPNLPETRYTMRERWRD